MIEIVVKLYTENESTQSRMATKTRGLRNRN